MNILLAEDEPPILRDIRNTIESFGEEYTVYASVANGYDAIAVLEQNGREIDLVIADIHMPMVDGLKLIEHIHEEYPHICCIILSGYSEFDYAKKAIAFGVSAYLLKPVDEEELRKQVRDVYEQKLLASIQGKPSVHGVPGKAESGYYAALVCAGPFPAHSPAENLASPEIWEGIDLEKVFNRHPDLFTNFWITDGHSACEKNCLFSLATAFDAAQADIEAAFSGIMKGFLPVTVAIGNEMCDIYCVASSIHNLRRHLSKNIVFGKSQVLFYPARDNEVIPEKRLHLQEKSATLQALFQEKNILLFGTELRDYLSRMQQAELTQRAVTTHIAELLRLCMLQADQEATLALQVEELSKENVMLSASYAALYDNLTSVFKDLFESSIDRANTATNKQEILVKLDSYLRRHYTEMVNTIQVAEHFGFTPAYLSKIFREYKSMTPSDYIKHLRIEKAKSLFLNNPGAIIKDVAQLVGYQDSLYFSKVFKKHTGLSPTQFVGSSPSD